MIKSVVQVTLWRDLKHLLKLDANLISASCLLPFSVPRPFPSHSTACWFESLFFLIPVKYYTLVFLEFLLLTGLFELHKVCNFKRFGCDRPSRTLALMKQPDHSSLARAPPHVCKEASRPCSELPFNQISFS